MDIRIPLISISVIIILVVVFLRKGLPQLISSQVFFLFLVMAFFNNLCEMFQCAVFVYLDDSFQVLRRITQNLYVTTLLAAVFMLCIYVYAKTTYLRIITFKALAIGAVPLLVGIISLCFGKVSYGELNGRFYNYGTSINVCYFLGFTYLILTLLRIVILSGRVPKAEYYSILSGLSICLLLAALQFIRRDIQVSALAMMLVALIIFIIIENPREFYEKSRENIRNSEAFVMIVTQKFGMKRHFFIVSVIMTGRTSVMSVGERKELIEKQTQIAQMAERNIRTSAYLFNWNTLCFILNTPEQVESFMNLINNYKGTDASKYRLIFSVLELPKYVESADKVMQLLSYVSGEYVFTQSTPNLVIDKAVVDKMEFRNSIEDIVRQAVKDKAFDVYYQPILCVEDGSFSSAEALVRLKRPDNQNYISPEDFIPVAEKCGLIQEIDDLVFEKVCSFIAREKIQNYGIRTVEVNLSGNEAVDEHTYSRLINKMNKYHIPPNFINFEITETSYISNDEVFKENVNKLKEMGSTISMDDFGSGYSNLLEILKMDYALVKLDKEFVWNCLDMEKPENMRMLDYTINFLKDYGLHILAEGVETMDQAKLLIDKGVEYLQGFYYSRPVPEEEYLSFLKTQKGMFQKLN